MQDNENDIKMNAQEVSKYLRISLSTVHHLTRTGRLKSVKVGKQWIYNRDDIDHYLDLALENVSTDAHTGDERRNHQRKKCFISGHARISFEDRLVWEGEGNILDFSLGGLLFEADSALENALESLQQSHAVIKLQIPSLQNVEYGFEGNVAHIHKSEKARFGIKFRELLEQDSGAILSHIS